MTPTAYVAIGDSFTEGKGDLHPDGSTRGFADLLAQSIATANPHARYANLARPSVTAGEIATRQVPLLSDLAPDLVTLNCGINDIIAVTFRKDAVRRAVVDVMRGTRAAVPGARILALSLPDITHVSTVARLAHRRILALDRMIHEAARSADIEVVDLDAGIPISRDELALDRVHPSPVGHLRFAAALCRHLGLPPPAPDFMAPRPRVQGVNRAYRTVVVAPKFVGRRLARDRHIVDQPAKRPDLLPLS